LVAKVGPGTRAGRARRRLATWRRVGSPADGYVPYRYLSKIAGDHPPMNEVLAALAATTPVAPSSASFIENPR